MYEIVPVAPSSSVTVAVRTWSSVAVPDIATVEASFTFATADVAALVELSDAPRASVYAAVTVIALPTSD